MNLQLFAEESPIYDDVILPDDFTDTPTDETEVVEDNQDGIEEPQNTLEGQDPQEPQQEPLQDIPKIKVKFNHEEKELTLDEATLYAQKGMNYDKVIERLNEVQNNPGLQYLNDLANKNNMSVEDLVGYWRQQEEQQMINELVQKNIPEEYAREMVENRKFREQLNKEKEQQTKMTETKQKEEAEIKAFMDAFPDVKPDDIPQEVIDKVQAGTPLKYAYMEHQYSQLTNKVKTLETNISNTKKAPLKAGVSSFGGEEPTSEDDFLKGFNSI